MVKRSQLVSGYGFVDWLVQRITACVLLLSAVLLGGQLLTTELNYDSFTALFGHGLNQWLSFILIIALIWHAWIGARDVLMDYIHHTGARLALIGLLATVLIGHGGWAISIIWSIK